MAPPESRFDRFVARRTADAEHAALHPLVTTDQGPRAPALSGVGNAWTTRLYDGLFHLVDPPSESPAISLVFVQSRDGNTAIANPADLGGGPTDQHLIYEGLTRVAADAVMAGAGTATGTDTFFSVWHPELVALRQERGLPRHPAQIVVSARGRDLDVERCLLFNVPEVPVFLLAGTQGVDRCAAAIGLRPWVTVIPLEPDGLPAALIRLRRDHGIARISAVGGRTLASSLLDAGLVQDICLTTTARTAGEPNTPFYTGTHPPHLKLIVRKTGTDPGYPIVVEHSEVRGGAQSHPRSRRSFRGQ